MSHTGATVLLMAPGRSTIRLELPARWPLSLLAALLVPVSMGVAARHGWEAMRYDSTAIAMARAGELTGSLYRARNADSPSSARRRPAIMRGPARSAALSIGGIVPALRGGTMSMPSPAPRASVRSAATLVATAPREGARTIKADGASAAASVISAAPILHSFRVRAGHDLDADGNAQEAGPGTILRMSALRLGESVRIQPFDETGAPQPEAFAALSHLMRCRVTGEEIAVDPRLVRILIQLAADYARPIQLISGHRAAHANGTSPTSQHTTGRAADIRIAGVTIEELQRRAIELGANGVGLYPEKGFVHVDVRPRPRAYWLYTAAAGEQLFDRLAPLPDPTTAAPSVEPPTGEHADGD